MSEVINDSEVPAESEKSVLEVSDRNDENRLTIESCYDASPRTGDMTVHLVQNCIYSGNANRYQITSCTYDTPAGSNFYPAQPFPSSQIPF